LLKDHKEKKALILPFLRIMVIIDLMPFPIYQ